MCLARIDMQKSPVWRENKNNFMESSGIIYNSDIVNALLIFHQKQTR